MTEHPELEQLFGTVEAAALMGVSTVTIHSWRRRNHLTPAAFDVNGWPLYRGMDLLRAEAKTRRRARRA